MAVRRSISIATRQLVLLEAGYKCANPTCRHILTLELHHIVWVKDNGGAETENLLALCPNCHSLHTAGHIPSHAIGVWKSVLVSLTSPYRGSADFLLVLYEEEKRLDETSEDQPFPPAFRFTGDSLPLISGLIVSDLVTISRRLLGGGYWGGGQPSFELRLTEQGRHLVEAWRSGLPDQVRIAITPGTGSLSIQGYAPTVIVAPTRK